MVVEVVIVPKFGTLGTPALTSPLLKSAYVVCINDDYHMILSYVHFLYNNNIILLLFTVHPLSVRTLSGLSDNRAK